MRKPIIAGNWKMYNTVEESLRFLEEFNTLMSKSSLDTVDVVICPPFTSIFAMKDRLSPNVRLGAQNMYHKENGAFTGEISGNMLLDAGAEYVILGHSERRNIFNEDDELINEKVKASLKCGLKPMLCVGETESKRKSNQTESVLKTQLDKGLDGIGIDDVKNLIIAYEPVWAIGTGVNATPAEAEETISYIRNYLASMYSKDVSSNIRIIYGGSVKGDNIKAIMAEKNIDGVLVGGASIKPSEFFNIICQSLEQN